MTERGRTGLVAVASIDAGSRVRVTLAAAVTLALASLLLVLVSPAAQADTYPGAGAVRAAKEAVRNQASTIADLDAAIVSLEQAMEEAETAVYVAQEAYTQAQWENIEAQRQLFAANNRADEAESALEDARADLANIAMMSYREGGTFGSFEAIMTSDGFEDVIVRSEAIDRASRDASLAIEQVRAAELVAGTMRQYAEEAAGVASEAELASRGAYAAAVEAERQARVALEETSAAREAAVARLAELQRVSQDLERQRQSGLANARAARQAAYWANWVATSGSSGGAVTPTAGVSIGTAEQGETAVAFALAQVGEPYVYGAAGPDAWDCSGLTGAAWRYAGVNLPRSSKAQYGFVGKAPYSDLRKGDLIFFGTNQQASLVYHATMYIGDNMIVEAPRPGYSVKVRDYRLWNVGNLMPWVGRP
jgi:cell wall-associated NlpC family hydrolase